MFWRSVQPYRARGRLTNTKSPKLLPGNAAIIKLHTLDTQLQLLYFVLALPPWMNMHNVSRDGLKYLALRLKHEENIPGFCFLIVLLHFVAAWSGMQGKLNEFGS